MKKLIALMLALVFVLTMMAGCGDEAKTDDTSAVTTDAKGSTATKAGTTSADIPGPVIGDDDDDDDDDEKLDTDVYFYYGTPVIDGSRDDIWDKAQTVSIDQVKTGNVTDAKIYATAMWDNTAIYFLFEIEDETFSFDSTVGDWHNDSIYLYISEDMDYAYDISAAGQFANGTYQFALIPNELEMIPRNGESVEYETAYNLKDNKLVIEFKYTPTEEMKADTLKAGRQVFIDYQYNDCNSSNTRDCALGYYNPTDTNFTPTLWGVGELLAEGTAVPADAR